MPQMDSGKALAANLWRSENTRAKEGAGKKSQVGHARGMRPPLGSKPLSRAKKPRIHASRRVIMLI